MKKLIIYDTTLRDGSQAEDVSMSVEDKLRINEKLDELGIHYIEGGWPGSNPKDAEYFKKAKKIDLKNATLVAFGSTRRAGQKVENDKNIRTLLNAGTEVITIVGKTWDFHVTKALKVSLDENLELINSSILYLKKHIEKVFFDAEHFFDGYKNNPDFSIECLKAAEDAGADCLVLCDTNGGSLPEESGKITREVKKRVKTSLGIHTHNDSDCAVANSIMAVRSGAIHIQGTINGLGERCGNANLCSLLPNLQLKLGYECISDDKLKLVREVSRYVNEITNLRHFKRQPFVGDSAFAHKGGIHVSAIRKSSKTYEHINPELVGNSQRVLISDLAGRSNVLRKAEEFGIDLDKKIDNLGKIIERLKELENQGFQFEGAEASFELLMKKHLGLYKKLFNLIGFRVIVEKRKEGDDPICEATIMVQFPDGNIEHTAATGNGPVNALDNALRKALYRFYPELKSVELHDYKVRVLTAGEGTAAKVRVLIESGDNGRRWGTVGVSENVVEASWQALVDSIEYKLLKEKS